MQIGPHFFLHQFKNKIVFNFVIFVATKKVGQPIFFHPSLLLPFLDPGSGIRDLGTEIRDLGTGIWEPGSGNRDLGTGIWEPGSGNRDLGTRIWEPGSGIQDPGSRIWDRQKPGSGINIPDPQHCVEPSFSYREKGTMLGKIIMEGEEEAGLDWLDPNTLNLVAEVSTKVRTRKSL